MALTLKANDCLGGESNLCLVVGLIEILSFFLLASNIPNPGIDTELPFNISSFRQFAKEANKTSAVSASICRRLRISDVISFVFNVYEFYKFATNLAKKSEKNKNNILWVLMCQKSLLFFIIFLWLIVPRA